jgi:hypothetical protein
MANLYCVLCKTKHFDFNWRYKTWQIFSGNLENNLEGWACSKWFHPVSHEFVPDRIKQERRKYWRDMVKPYRGGQLSKEFCDLYPKQVAKMVKAGSVKPQDIRKAKNVWGDLH